ncbi:unnamed protein product [Ectocarpus sp. 6 AP-2014]
MAHSQAECRRQFTRLLCGREDLIGCSSCGRGGRWENICFRLFCCWPNARQHNAESAGVKGEQRSTVVEQAFFECSSLSTPSSRRRRWGVKFGIRLTPLKRCSLM